MSQTVPKGRIAQITVAVPVPETANPKEVQEWVAKALTGRGDMNVTHPLYGAEFDPLRVDINMTDHYVEYKAEDLELKDGDQVTFRHVVKTHQDRRSMKQVKGWKSRKQVFEDARQEAIQKKAETDQ